MTLSIITHSQEHATIRRIIEFDFKAQDEVAELLFGHQEAATIGRVLDTNEVAVDHFPFATPVKHGNSIVLPPTRPRLAIK